MGGPRDLTLNPCYLQSQVLNSNIRGVPLQVKTLPHLLHLCSLFQFMKIDPWDLGTLYVSHIIGRNCNNIRYSTEETRDTTQGLKWRLFYDTKTQMNRHKKPKKLS